jgi:glycosyltransferase involved in cell wall biosynthesis
MNNSPLISSIIIFLNTEKYLQEAIESVFSQTYDNWELLLVDDGSTDRSTEIAMRYAGQYSGKVRYLEHPEHQNLGMGASRNLGVRHAKGEYIALLDSDDVWLPHKLEQQAAILDSHPGVGMVYGLSQYWRGWTGVPEDVQRDFVPELGIQGNRVYEPPALLTLLYPLGTATPPCPSDLLLRRETVERVGGFAEAFKGNYHLYEDQAFLAKVYLQEPVYVADACWDKYRQHPEQCVAVVNKAGHYHAVRLYFLDWLATYLDDKGIKDGEVWQLLQRAQLHTHSKQLQKLERDLRRERRKLEQELRRERQKVRRLTLRMQELDERTPNGFGSKFQRSFGRISENLRARLLKDEG